MRTSDNGYFNPRAPYGARHVLCLILFIPFAISIHAPRTGRDRGPCGHRRTRLISIHAPRTGRDLHAVIYPHGVVAISIHAPRTGRDLVQLHYFAPLKTFQSTRPVRGATADG